MPVTRKDAEDEMEKVVRSRAFRKRAPDSSKPLPADERALRYVATRVLADPRARPSPFQVALGVYGAAGKRELNNLRVLMKSVRDKVREYFKSEGRDDPVRITFKTYTPDFNYADEGGLEIKDFFGEDGNVERILPDVRFCSFPHANANARRANRRDTISLTLEPEPGTVKFAPPLWGPNGKTIRNFVREIVKDYDFKTFDWYRTFLHKKQKSPFVKKDQFRLSSRHRGKREIINALVKDPTSPLKERRIRNIENLLLTNTWPDDPEAVWKRRSKAKNTEYNHLEWNGGNLILLSLQRHREEYIHYECVFVRSDYYTYRCIGDCSDWIRGRLPKFLGDGENGLRSYLAKPQLIHGGTGFLIVVSTGDGNLIIRRRSDKCANYKDANKLCVAANEGLRFNKGKGGDIRPDGSLKPCIEIVKRMLRNELLGINPRAEELMADMQCDLTGVLLYLPNFSVNLCFLVHLEETKVDEVKRMAARAPHAREFIEEETKGIPFNRTDVCSYVLRTREGNSDGQSAFAKSWCEGSLVPFYLSLLRS